MDFGVPHFHTNPYVHLYTARMIFSIRGRQNSAKQNSSTCLSKMLPLHGPSKIAATHGRIDDVQLKVPALGTTVCKLAMLLAISKPQPTSNGSKMNLWRDTKIDEFLSRLFYLLLIKIIRRAQFQDISRPLSKRHQNLVQNWF